MDDIRRIRLRIRGRVQGVGFRHATRQEARRIGLRGWVRNEVDGSVTAVAEGAPASVEAFVRWCHDGPPRARVEDVELHDVEPAVELPEPFAVRS